MLRDVKKITDRAFIRGSFSQKILEQTGIAGSRGKST